MTTTDHLKAGARLAWRRLTLPFRLLLTLSKATLAMLALCFFLLSLALPVVTAVSSTAFEVVAWVAEAVTTLPSVLSRQAKIAEEVLAKKNAALAAEKSARTDATIAAEKATGRAAAAELKTEEALTKAASAERKATAASAELAEKEAELVAEKTARAEAIVATERAGTRASQAVGRAAAYELRIANLEAELATKAAEKVTYRGELRLLSEAVADATGRVTGRIAGTFKADMASMAGQAIPYLGVTAIVGSMGYDAYQSCEMLKELHELDVAFNPKNSIVDAANVCGTRIPTASEIWASAKAAPGAAMQAAKAALPAFNWQAGWTDLIGHVPTTDEVTSTAAKAMDTVVGWLPTFYWKEGWDDIVAKTKGLF